MRFQDCNGLLQGRIHDGVTCVILHVAVEMFPWTLCFLSLSVVLIEITYQVDRFLSRSDHLT